MKRVTLIKKGSKPHSLVVVKTEIDNDTSPIINISSPQKVTQKKSVSKKSPDPQRVTPKKSEKVSSSG